MIDRPDWTLREVFIFDATMRLGSLTKAASEMGLGQPAASKLIASLEDKVGTTLFDRQNRQLLPTNAAIRFHGHVRDIVDIVTRVPEQKTEPREITVAVPPPFAEGFIQDAARKFLAAAPKAKLVIEVTNIPNIEELVAEGRLDLGISDGRVSNSNIRAIPFRESMLTAFLSETHALANHGSLTAKDLAGHKLILLTRRHASRTHLERLFSKQPTPPDYTAEVSSATAAVHLAKQLDAVAIVSAFPIDAYLPNGMTSLPFPEGRDFTSRFLLPTWKSPSMLTKALMTAVKQTAEKFEESALAKQDDNTGALVVDICGGA